MRTTSFGGKNFIFVIVNDFSRFTQVLLLAHKSDVKYVYKAHTSGTIRFGGKNFIFVIVDCYSRFTQVLLLAYKNEAFDVFSSFANVIKKNVIMQLLI